jgi:hypothetical protein
MTFSSHFTIPGGGAQQWLRPLAGLLPVLAGVGLFVAVVAGSGAQTTDCVPPATTVCPLGLNRPEAAVLNDASIPHVWSVEVPFDTTFTVALTALQADFDLVITGPDGTVIAESHNPGTTDEVIEVLNAPGGSYRIQVTTPNGETSVLPYFIRAQLPPAPEVQPEVNPYDIAPPAEPLANPYNP